VFDACLDIEWWDLGKNQVREVKVINDGNTRGVYPLLFSANNRALIIKQGLGTVCFYVSKTFLIKFKFYLFFY
jgi:hypothetical protein